MTLALVSTFIITASQDNFIENVFPDELQYDFCFSLIVLFFSTEAYSTLDQRERRHTLDETTDTLPVL